MHLHHLHVTATHVQRNKAGATVFARVQIFTLPHTELGIDTLRFLFCLLCYSPIPKNSAYYAQEHAYYSQEGTYYSCS